MSSEEEAQMPGRRQAEGQGVDPEDPSNDTERISDIVGDVGDVITGNQASDDENSKLGAEQNDLLTRPGDKPLQR